MPTAAHPRPLDDGLPRKSWSRTVMGLKREMEIVELPRPEAVEQPSRVVPPSHIVYAMNHGEYRIESTVSPNHGADGSIVQAFVVTVDEAPMVYQVCLQPSAAVSIREACAGTTRDRFWHAVCEEILIQHLDEGRPDTVIRVDGPSASLLRWLAVLPR